MIVQLRDDGTNHFHGNAYLDNTVRLSASNAVELAVKPGIELRRAGTLPAYTLPKVPVLGHSHPVGARAAWRGRDQILMDEWGPWDHASPLVRSLGGAKGEQRWEILGVRGLHAALRPGNARLVQEASKGTAAATIRVTAGPGVTPYEIDLRGDGFARTLRGQLIVTAWEATFFPWTSVSDPRTNLMRWRLLAQGESAVRAEVGALDFNYGGRGPRDLKISDEVTRRGPGPEHFGMIARTRLALPAGRWSFRTLSDDGVRVSVGGRVLIENWNWHGPTTDEAILEQATSGDVEILVEHFEIDGHAVLQFDLAPAP